ncbi:hypothetical protein P4S72_26420 [Vibrio sp. PP-XX7]
MGEQDPLEIWQATQDAIRACIQGFDLDDLKGLQLVISAESILIWDRDSGLPLTPIVSWQAPFGVSVETISVKQGLNRFSPGRG